MGRLVSNAPKAPPSLRVSQFFNDWGPDIYYVIMKLIFPKTTGFTSAYFSCSGKVLVSIVLLNFALKKLEIILELILIILVGMLSTYYVQIQDVGYDIFPAYIEGAI